MMATSHDSFSRGDSIDAPEEALLPDAHDEREHLLEPETLRQSIRFVGHRPYLDPAYRRRLLMATASSIASELKTSSPENFLRRHARSILAIPANLYRIRLNRQVTERMAQALDDFDARLLEQARTVNPHEEPDRWDQLATPSRAILATEIARIWSEYERDYERAPLASLLENKRV